jgi:hypothetical protein
MELLSASPERVTPIPPRENLVNARTFPVDTVIYFDRADGYHMLHRRAWADECAAEYHLDMIASYLARGEDSALDYPIALRTAMNAATTARAGFYVPELSSISSNPNVLLDVIATLRRPVSWSSAGIPLIVAGYGSIAHNASS